MQAVEKIHINFYDYHTLKFGVWVDWCKSGLNGIAYFLKGIEVTEKSADVVNDWLGFFNTPYDYGNEELCFDREHVGEKKLKQKINALTILQKNENVFDYLPKIISEFSEIPMNEVLNLPFDVAFEQGIYYLKTLNEVEEALSQDLKQHIPTNEEIEAGYNELQWLSNYGMYDMLAGGDILKHEAVLNVSVQEAHAKIIYTNQMQHYQEKLQKIFYKPKK